MRGAARGPETVVAVTGGAGGIGRALARAFTAAGALVALLDRDRDALARAAADIPGRVLAVVCDVTDPTACEAAIADVVEAFGRLDVLVANAGISHHSPARDTDDAVLQAVMQVNFFGAVYAARAALPHLQPGRGVIVVISSVAGFAPLVDRAAYAASKHALHGYFDSLRAELADEGVGVMLVCPSFVDTGLRWLDGRGAPVPTDRAAQPGAMQPDDVARAVVQGVRRGRRQLAVGRVARLAWWLTRLSPRAWDALMRRSQRRDDRRPR